GKKARDRTKGIRALRPTVWTAHCVDSPLCGQPTAWWQQQHGDAKTTPKVWSVTRSESHDLRHQAKGCVSVRVHGRGAVDAMLSEGCKGGRRVLRPDRAYRFNGDARGPGADWLKPRLFALRGGDENEASTNHRRFLCPPSHNALGRGAVIPGRTERSSEIK
ncbi:hypothetical protein NHX12_005190, partial [Muraenolepis orangiensis]